jgi:uncharacterized tellurite resistance protein B-like protein
MSLLRYFGITATSPAAESRPIPNSEAETTTVRKIVAALDRLPPEQSRYLAALAAILSRVARADLTVSDDETRVMESIIAETGGLPEEQAVLVVQMAKTQNLLFGATENFLVTREFGKIASEDQKLDALRCCFAVSAADENISGIEDHTVRQIASELKIEHADYIRVRSEFRDRLAVLRRPPENAG